MFNDSSRLKGIDGNGYNFYLMRFMGKASINIFYLKIFFIRIFHQAHLNNRSKEEKK